METIMVDDKKKKETCANCTYNKNWFCIIAGTYVKREGHCSEHEKK
jgi:hypothetical protein